MTVLRGVAVAVGAVVAGAAAAAATARGSALSPASASSPSSPSGVARARRRRPRDGPSASPPSPSPDLRRRRPPRRRRRRAPSSRRPRRTRRRRRPARRPRSSSGGSARPARRRPAGGRRARWWLRGLEQRRPDGRGRPSPVPSGSRRCSSAASARRAAAFLARLRACGRRGLPARRRAASAARRLGRLRPASLSTVGLGGGSAAAFFAGALRVGGLLGRRGRVFVGGRRLRRARRSPRRCRRARGGGLLGGRLAGALLDRRRRVSRLGVCRCVVRSGPGAVSWGWIRWRDRRRACVLLCPEPELRACRRRGPSAPGRRHKAFVWRRHPPRVRQRARFVAPTAVAGLDRWNLCHRFRSGRVAVW